MALTPLSEIRAKHRGRAIERRKAWADVGLSARTVMAALQTAAAPEPEDGAR